MGAIVYPAGDMKYITWSGDGQEDVDDANTNMIDFSRYENIHAVLLVKSWTGTPTNVVVKIQSSNFGDSTDADDWVDIITFTTVTTTPTKEIKVSSSGVMPYLRIDRAFSGGSSPTMTGYVLIRGVAASYPV